VGAGSGPGSRANGLNPEGGAEISVNPEGSVIVKDDAVVGAVQVTRTRARLVQHKP